MSIRRKVFTIFFITALPTVMLFNYIYSSFFINFLIDQEERQIDLSVNSISSYLVEKNSKYVSVVNDWSHWDDTYFFIKGTFPEYIDQNLTESTFDNLGLNFMAFITYDSLVREIKYYDLDKGEFLPVSESLVQEFLENNSITTLKEDSSGIYYFDNSFYFIAISDITDSMFRNKADAIMIIGRRIDGEVIKEIEKIGNGKIVIDVTANVIEDTLKMEPNVLSVQNLSINENKELITITMALINNYDNPKSLFVTLTKKRELYIDGISNIKRFAIINIIVMISLGSVIFTLIGKVISLPIKNLIKDVNAKNIKKVESTNWFNNNEDEVWFLREAIRTMVEKIDTEQDRARESEEKLLTTLLSVGDGVITVDENRRIQFSNVTAQKLTGWNKGDMFSKDFEEVFHIFDEATKERIENPLSILFKGQEVLQLPDYSLLISEDGQERLIEGTLSPIKGKSGKVVGCVFVFRDNTDKKRKLKEIEYLSFHDYLTGIYNRRYLEDSLLRLDTGRNFPLTLMVIDLDGLKIINDNLGHEVGDQFLKKTAEILKKVCRQDDILGRLGGDEFLIILPKTDEIIAKSIKERILIEVAKVNLDSVRLSLSCGYATKIDSKKNIKETLKDADGAMYEDKLAGRK